MLKVMLFVRFLGLVRRSGLSVRFELVILIVIVIINKLNTTDYVL